MSRVQKIIKLPLTKDGQFIVGEEKILDYILASLFFVLFLYGFIDAILSRFSDLNASSVVFLIALSLAFLFFQKGRSKRIYIRINKKGIYQDEQLVVSWPHFSKAFITQKEKMLSYQDNFILVIEFRKKDATQIGRRVISLTNTQNRSEEEIIEAIRFFWKGYKDEGDN